MITLHINGKEVKLTEPTTVLQAARLAGFTIPTLCDYELLEPEGNCRLCLVEVENMPRLQTACTLRTIDGMVVRTDTEEIEKTRRAILEFFLINHPLDCPTCDKAGECTLQELVILYGAAKGRFREVKKKKPDNLEDPIIARNMQRCIKCSRCIRMCRDVQGANALSFVSRGQDLRVVPFSEKKYNCEYCGNCITVCPVGSILSRVHLHGNRPWQVSRHVHTICGYCPVGCSVTVRVRDERIRRIIPHDGYGVNKGLLCVRGRFGYDYINHRDRLKTPLIKKKGEFYYCSWEEAYTFIARRIQEIINKYGADALGALASGYVTNETNYVFQKFIRAVVGTNNIDSTARLDVAGAQRVLESLLYTGVTNNSLDSLSDVDTIMVFGGDPTVINPILGVKIRGAFKNGAKVITLSPAGGLRKFTTLEIVTPVYGENHFFDKLIAYLYSEKGLRRQKRAIEEWIDEKARSQEPGDVTIPRNAFYIALNILLKSSEVAIVIGPELIQRSDGYLQLASIAALAALLKVRFYLMSERPNNQGAVDMGCVPDSLPGRGLVSDSNLRKRYEESWNVTISDNPGLTVMEIIEEAQRDIIKALYIMGENPVLSLPNNKKIKKSLQNLDLLIVQDIFLTETARLAHVVLPARGWTEETGTFTNLEGRIQMLSKAVPGHGCDNWKIVADIAGKMGYPMEYKNSEAIFNEIAEIVPLYKGLTYKNIGSDTNMWPYMSDSRDFPVIQENSIALSHYVERPKFEGIIDLKCDHILFHSGTLSQMSSFLNKISSEPVLRVSSALMKEYRLVQGETVIVSSVIDTVEIRVEEDPYLPLKDIVFLDNNFPVASAYRLLGYTLDPVTKAPGCDGWKVTIRRKGQV
jgi:NADH-quinone oxidoreductase chain G